MRRKTLFARTGPYCPLKPETSPRRQPKIGLITNPHSRRNRSQLAAVRRIVANQANILHHITDSVNQLPGALRDFATKDVDVLAINGGDGTTAQVMGELLQERPFAAMPAIILLPGGTTNMNVGDAGVPGKLSKAVSRMAQWANGDISHAHHVTRPILRVEGAAHGKPAYGMFFGAGAIINGIEYCHNNVHSVGIGDEIGPGIALLRTLWGILRKDTRFAAPTRMRIDLDANTGSPPREVLLFLASSLERLFLGMHPYWGQEDAALHCTWVEMPAPRLLRLFPGLLRGKPGAFATRERGYFSHNADQIRLWLDGSFTLDGEMYQARKDCGPLIISNGGELEFIRITH